MNANRIAASLSALVIVLVASTAAAESESDRALASGRDKSVNDAGAMQTLAEFDAAANRLFRGRGFHARLEFGPAYGQQVIGVERVDVMTAVTGESQETTAVASGFGVAGRLELWPIYGSRGGVGVLGQGNVGAARREGGGTGVVAGSACAQVMLGAPQLKMMFQFGRSRRFGAYGSGSDLPAEGETLSQDAHYVAGLEDIQSYRAGLGLRASFSADDRRGLDAWVLLDESVDDRGAFAMPSVATSAVSIRASLWLRNILAVSGQVSVRPETVGETDEGAAITERSAMVAVAWSMDRFSRPY